MANIIEFNNVSFKYSDKAIFSNFDLKIKDNSYTTIIGNSGSGKTTLIKILLGLIPFNGEVLVNNLLLNKENIKSIRKVIGVVFETLDSQFIMETVYDELSFPLENLNYSTKEIKEKITEIADQLEIKHLLNNNPYTLSGGEKQIVLLAVALIKEPLILILDESLTMIDPIMKEKIANIIDVIHRDKQMTIINITQDSEEILKGDDIIILNEGKLIAQGKKEIILKNEKAFKQIGLSLPFIIELSNKLKYYELITKTIYDIEKMVNVIWP